MARVNRGVAGAIVIGVLGTALLCALGAWQVQRLDWKERLIAEIEARLSAEPVALPEAPSPDRHQFLRVAAEGRLAEGVAYRLTTQRPYGAGYQVIVPVETGEGRRILADLGYIQEDRKGAVLPAPGTQISLTGALFWPESEDSFTPEPDLDRQIWFARDVDALAQELGTEPALIVAERHSLGEAPVAQRVAHNLPNDHLGYAITWFSLAGVWAAMSLAWGRSARRRP